MKRFLIAAALLAVLTGALGAQTTPSPGASPAAAPGTPATAQPYTDEEFAPWVLKVRRAEILAVGAFPLAYLFAGLGYDYYYYMSHGFRQENAPWPVGAGTSQWTAASQGDNLQQKNLTLVGVSVAAGLLLAAVDWVLGEVNP